MEDRPVQHLVCAVSDKSDMQHRHLLKQASLCE
jgi:hypothetical protein